MCFGGVMRDGVVDGAAAYNYGVVLGKCGLGCVESYECAVVGDGVGVGMCLYLWCGVGGVALSVLQWWGVGVGL